MSCFFLPVFVSFPVLSCCSSASPASCSFALFWFVFSFAFLFNFLPWIFLCQPSVVCILGFWTCVFRLPARRVCTSLNNFSSSATLFFHHATFWRQILHLQLHFIYLISNFKPRSPFYTRPCVFKMTDTLRPAEVFFRVVACRRLHARIL